MNNYLNPGAILASDSWGVEGTEFQKLEPALRRLDTATEKIAINSKEIRLLTLIGKTQDAAGTEVYSYYVHPSDIGNVRITNIPCHLFKEKGWEETEILASTLVLMVGQRLYVTNDLLLDTLKTRAGLSGNTIGNTASLDVRYGRDFAMAKILQEKDVGLTLIVREEKNAHTGAKAWALATTSFQDFPQSTVIMDILRHAAKVIGGYKWDSQIGNTNNVQVKWSMNNKYTHVYIDFIEKASEIAQTYGYEWQLIPYVHIQNSGTLCSSLIVEGGFRTSNGGGYLLGYSGGLGSTKVPTSPGCILSKHEGTGDFDLQKFLDKVDKNLFTLYTRDLERFFELEMTQVDNPLGVLDTLVMGLMRKRLGDANARALIALLKSQVDEGLYWSAFSLVCLLMDSVGNIEYKDNRGNCLTMCEDDITALQQMISQAIWWDGWTQPLAMKEK